MLFVGSWYDIYTDGVIQAFDQVRSKGTEQAGAHSKLLMGPWYHSGYDQLESGSLQFANAQGYSLKKAQAFFDYWMRQVPNDFDAQQPAIEYYQMGANQWRSTSVWPPSGVTDRSYYLQPDRSISHRTSRGRQHPAVDVSLRSGEPGADDWRAGARRGAQAGPARPAREGGKPRRRAGLFHARPGK